MITKLNHEKVRSFFQIGALAAFVLFALVSVIKLSFRWYGLALLLLVWAALGAWTLVGKKPQKEYKAKLIVRRAITGGLLVFVALIPVLIFPQYQSPRVTGTHAAITVNYTYTDTSRAETFSNTGEHRKVNVECWYPKDGGGPYPLIVFSHGAFGIKISNTSTFMELASNGYVVCSIDHPYHSLFTIDADGHRALIVAVKHVTATAPNAYEVHLAGTDHMSVTDLPLISPFFVSMINASVPKAGGQEVDPLATIETMNDLVLNFFNAYLKSEGNFATTGTN